MTTIEEIHESLVNGQRRQMARQIQEYGAGDFFPEYKEYLELDPPEVAYKWFSDATISYHRIIGR